jgi:hypothetical protein
VTKLSAFDSHLSARGHVVAGLGLMQFKA